MTQNRYTVHLSDSPELNAIKFHHTNVRTGTQTLMHLTTALKVHDAFAPLCFVGQAHPDAIAANAVINKPDDRTIKMGSYDPDNEQLRFMVVVSNTARGFRRFPSAQGPNCCDSVFRRFRVTLLWWTWPYPSTEDGFHLNFTTSPETGPMTRRLAEPELREWFGIGFRKANAELMYYLGKSGKIDVVVDPSRRDQQGRPLIKGLYDRRRT